jgi:protein-serine/threonine kinase
LYYALATPFVETSGFVMDNNLPKTPTSAGSQSPTTHQSSVALNLLNTQTPITPNPLTHNQGNINRPFHSLAAKRGLPQSVFTVSFENPWEVRAANDLACIMFGVSRNSIKHLTFMDLIAPQFRDFVANRLVSGNLSQSVKKNLHSSSLALNNIYFAGEIIAISCPGHNKYTYTSLWAKKRGDLIICMFDQIPCDAFNVLISRKEEDEGNKNVHQEYSIDNVTEIAGTFFKNMGTDKFDSLGQLSNTLSKELANLRDGSNANEHSDPSQSEIQEPDSEYINKTRYYTLQLNDEFVPCAITSSPLDSREDVHEIKLNIHTLPYIAGMFVIDSHDYSILSCNNAIAKNLFGKSLHEILNKSIDTLIPKFSKIFTYGIDSNVDLNFIQGLVLPEHFFRKYDAILKSHEQGTNNEEDLFFKSKGIEGIHRDGNPILIDVQLRDSGSGTFVVWITYSRATNKSEANDLQKLVPTGQDSSSPIAEGSEIEEEKILNITNFKHKISPIPDLSAVTDNVKHRRVNTINHASQSTIAHSVPEDLDFAPSSAEISRKSSTRKAKAGTFGIPVSKLNKSLGDIMSWDTPRKVTLDETRKIRSISNNSIITSADSSETLDTDNTSVKSDLENTKSSQYSTYSEEEILKLEDEVLENIMTRSNEWPREVGLKRRTKKFSEFKILKNMGEGAYGKVVLVEHEKDPVYKIIMKCIDKKRILVDTWVRDRKLGTIPSEIQIMANLNSEPHPNIMRIVDFFEDSNYYYLETPIFGNPPAIDLFDYIEVKTDMQEGECQFIFKQICSAIYHLHNHGIVHRDIKDENVIVDENGLIKLIDFGSAGYTKQGPFDVFVGTIDYASPEVLRGDKYEGKPQDVWALGILLYTMLYKENPFYNVDEIMEGDLRIPRIISDGSIDLIQKILIRDLKNRSTITDIVEDPWLQ